MNFIILFIKLKNINNKLKIYIQLLNYLLKKLRAKFKFFI